MTTYYEEMRKDKRKTFQNGDFEMHEPVRDATYELKNSSHLNRQQTHRAINDSWPKPDKTMFYGLAGYIVEKIEPHTEADPTSLLIQTLTAYGNIIGRGAYFEVEADRHHANIFVTLVGETAKGRKGTSWGHVKRIFEMVAPDWKHRVMTGLSTGEGLMWAVRNREDNDENEEDKRLLDIEPEFASVLKVARREGNTLSAIIRQAWDGGTLSTLTRNNPLKADNSHISLISHVTKEELLRYLNSTESGNGFANRFLWVCGRRSKCLPRGGQISNVNFVTILKRLRASLDFAKDAGKIKPSEDTWNIWEKIYPDLSEGMPGLLGAVTSRAEAQTMRLAMIYALMDNSTVITPHHLKAALALWNYCFASARYIFGDNLGNPVADAILNALRNKPEGLFKNDIVNLFNRHKKAGEISQALNVLFHSGLVQKKDIKTRGRKKELWIASKES